jgi:hypothetical protein
MRISELLSQKHSKISIDQESCNDIILMIRLISKKDHFRYYQR